MAYEQIVENVSGAELKPFLGKAKAAYAEIIAEKIPLFHSLEGAEANAEIRLIKETASYIRDKFNHLVVIGTGGSTLGAQTYAGLCTKPSDISLHFMDNVDPDTVHNLLESLPLEETCFLVVSKSGTTLETISVFAICLDKMIEKFGDKDGSHFISVTIPADNPLRSICAKYNIKTLNHNPDISGRFSLLTVVGLLPALVIGLDIDKIRKEAVNTLHNAEKAIEGAALNLLAMERSIDNTVLISYIDRLAGFVTWWRQIWAESLGKNGNGTTPINAAGTLDQHSQLQLWLDGKSDKIFNFITVKNHNFNTTIDGELLDNDKLAYMNNCSLGDIIAASARATSETLVKNNMAVRNIVLDEVNESGLGEIIMHFTLETVITAKMLNINPFNQPAVEEGKILARKYLGETQ